MHAPSRKDISRRSMLLAALAGSAIPFLTPRASNAQGENLIHPDVKRVGMRLACLCKTCKNTVGDCQMMQCGYSSPARAKIATLLKAGKTDDEIVAIFVKDVGKQATSSPPAEGFSLTAWIMPGAFAAVGAGFIAWYLKREKAKTLAPLPEIDPTVLSKYQTRIEKEMADLD